ncbi:MAG: DM13 domain-containing protein [Terracidiphilus sp.]
MKKWKAAIPLLAPGLFAAWYAFRPERLIVNRRVNEGFPVAADPSSVTVAESGAFYGIRHSAEGTATIYRLANGDRLLRLTNFRTSNGPDVHVYLVAAADTPDNATVQRAGFIDLGTLKGNIGDQNYALPLGVDLSKYEAVSIWCKRFRVNFGAAPLRTDHTEYIAS